MPRKQQSWQEKINNKARMIPQEKKYLLYKSAQLYLTMLLQLIYFRLRQPHTRSEMISH